MCFLGLSPQTPSQEGLRPPGPPFGLGFAVTPGSWRWLGGARCSGVCVGALAVVAELRCRAVRFARMAAMARRDLHYHRVCMAGVRRR